MDSIVAIPLPLAHVGSVNAWLLFGDPVTLIDTGPRDDAALSALEDGLRRKGLCVEDIGPLELLLAAGAVTERSGGGSVFELTPIGHGARRTAPPRRRPVPDCGGRR